MLPDKNAMLTCSKRQFNTPYNLKKILKLPNCTRPTALSNFGCPRNFFLIQLIPDNLDSICSYYIIIFRQIFCHNLTPTLHKCGWFVATCILCGFRYCPYPPQGGSLESSRGKGIFLELKYEPKLGFLEGMNG